MIKIQVHLNRQYPDEYLDNIINDYWNNYLNPKKINGNYYQTSLIELCRKYYKMTEENSYIVNYANNKKYIAKKHKQFFKYLTKYDCRELKRIIFAKPEEFDSIKSTVLNILGKENFYTNNNGRITQTKFGELLTKKIFKYSSFRSSNYCINLYKLLGFKNCTCPYCNNSEVEIVYKVASTDEIAYFDLDHFYPKSQNPFFALSFFNLIPSCKTCNSTLKGSKDFSISANIHPYYESFDYFYQFKVPIESFFTTKVNEIQIDTKVVKDHDETLSNFNIKNRYENRKEKVEKLIRLYKNNQHRIDDFNEFIIDTCDLPRNISDILNKKNGKFLRDIALQLDEGHGRLRL
ncbi:MAG: hypothetical protein PHX13_03795 [Thiovulaceae bacterium]|nr:hypothetical protein [Sulfurimonadaceae bacterium]